MKFKNLLLINAIIFLAFGIGFIFFPSTLLSLYGASAEPSTMLSIQLYGSLLIGIGLLCWFSREVADPMALRAIQISFTIAYVINAILHVLGTVSGVINALGWSGVVIYLLLTAGYVYFYFTTPKMQEV